MIKPCHWALIEFLFFRGQESQSLLWFSNNLSVPSREHCWTSFRFLLPELPLLRLRTGTFRPRAPLSRCHQSPCCHCLCLRGCWRLAQPVSLALPPRALERPAPPLHPGSPGLQAPATTGKGWGWLGSQGWEGPRVVRGCWVHGHCCCGWKLPGVGVSPQLEQWGPRPHCLYHFDPCGHGES